MVQQAAIGNCLSFDPFSFDQNGLALPEVDVSWRQIVDALVIAQMIVVSDEGLDLSFEIARQVIVLEQDTVLERLMPALDLALGHRMIRRATDVPDILAIEPFGQVCRDVAGAVVGEKRTANSRGDKAGSSRASWTIRSRISSRMRFQTRIGRGERDAPLLP